MEFSSFFFHLLFFSLIFQLSNTIVSSAKVEIPAEDAHTDTLDSLTEQMDEKDADIGKRLVQQRIKRNNEDEVYIDYRESYCLDIPRSQGDCHASYAFATVAFYEWLNCQKTGDFEAYSEQYIIDCGRRHGNSGCNGGNVETANRFIDACGLALLDDYHYRGYQRRCAYSDSTPSKYMGSLRISEPLVKSIPLDQQSIEDHLQYGPIIVTIQISPQFVLYRGGVDDNVGHTHELLHTMLLIGHGREDGKDYWLFRNSLHAPGDDGIYKLNKNVDSFWGLFGIGLSGFVSI